MGRAISHKEDLSNSYGMCSANGRAATRSIQAVGSRAHSYLTRFTGKERVNFQVLNLRIVKCPNP